jgi:putative PIN family toxin of toxin-antitoxin system
VRRLTADTNLYVSALQFGGKPQTLLDIAQDGHIELALLHEILDKTLRILRDKFQRSFEHLADVAPRLRAVTVHVVPTERLDVVKTDASDNKVIECAVAAGSEVVISGDAHLLSLGGFRDIKIMRVAEFLSGTEPVRTGS